ncbi:MAG: NAD(+) kinase [Gammaproteobacteria bacterium]|jgi:NAD+ kinase|nr:NAD(+) kinase [Gammaproteobacteria bacterium]MBP6052925.1 NAD(+) kinase [Pseudomonadales bacterium]MBK6581959.1 NAD(+) kinase [Gammaproteobacteria bacterium]MBK7170366.1 NAD(+) kinase [Gammaproteobacteria bacterium]MBK7521778.1 NAD(+) kinase [Gammaproteobacteria bacterium]
MTQFSTIGLMGRVGSEAVLETLVHLRDFLRARGRKVIVEQEVAEHLGTDPGEVRPREHIGRDSDLVIVVGGDGSLLGAARSLAAQEVPVLGVNRGRLGFLTDISPQQLESQLEGVLAGRYVLESRFLLDVLVMRGEEVLARGDALNDVVLNSGVSARMIEFDLYIEEQFVYTQRSDGLIISTPTGSTAYSLSGGGPIMHPGLDALVLVPMFPHTLGSRPLVIHGNSSVRIVINEYNDLHPNISCDGQLNFRASPGDVIHIHKKPERLQLLHPLEHNFYAICRAKLGWGSGPGD